MQATGLVINATMCLAKGDFNILTINSYLTYVEMSVLISGQSIIHSYFNYFKEDYHV